MHSDQPHSIATGACGDDRRHLRLNFRPVRGASSRGGRKAPAAMVADLAEHPAAVHILDGPQGPRGVIKAGLVSLAQLSDAPVFPVDASVDRAWILNSWDRCLIPKPFDTVTVRWDEPMAVPASLSADEFEAVRRRIEKRMRENQATDDGTQGWRKPLLEKMRAEYLLPDLSFARNWPGA